MLTLEESRRLLGPLADSKTDEEVLAVRNAFYDLARIIVDGYIASRRWRNDATPHRAATSAPATGAPDSVKGVPVRPLARAAARQSRARRRISSARNPERQTGALRRKRSA